MSLRKEPGTEIKQQRGGAADQPSHAQIAAHAVHSEAAQQKPALGQDAPHQRIGVDILPQPRQQRDQRVIGADAVIFFDALGNGLTSFAGEIALLNGEGPMQAVFLHVAVEDRHFGVFIVGHTIIPHRQEARQRQKQEKQRRQHARCFFRNARNSVHLHSPFVFPLRRRPRKSVSLPRRPRRSAHSGAGRGTCSFPPGWSRRKAPAPCRCRFPRPRSRRYPSGRR